MAFRLLQSGCRAERSLLCARRCSLPSRLIAGWTASGPRPELGRRGHGNRPCGELSAAGPAAPASASLSSRPPALTASLPGGGGGDFPKPGQRRDDAEESDGATATPSPALPGARRLLTLAYPERWPLAAAVGFLGVSSIVTMSAPFFLGKVIDLIYTNPTGGDLTGSLTSLCTMLGGVFLCGAAANAARIYIMQVSEQQIIKRLRTSLFSSILCQEVGFFDKSSTGELINRLSSDADLLGRSVTMNLSDGLRAVAQAAAGVGMMFYVSPQLAMFVLGTVPPLALFGVIYGRYVRKLTKLTQNSLAGATQLAEERIGNIRTVRAFGKENVELEKYTEKVNYVMHLARKEAVALAGFFGATGLTGNLIILSVLYKGGLLMSSAHMTIGELSSFMMYAFWVGISITGLSSFYSTLMKGLGAGDRLWELLDRKPAVPLNEGKVLQSDQLKGAIKFHGVHFAYPTRKKSPIFQGLDLSIPAGSVMAVVGPSGSGKSTLVSLLLRLYDPSSGSITLDDHDTRTLNPYWLRKNIGTVSQEPVLFSCSIADNIAYGAVDPSQLSMKDIENVAKIANAFNFIESFPDGFKTVVGEKGVLLSGGQKQRIAIARALLKKCLVKANAKPMLGLALAFTNAKPRKSLMTYSLYLSNPKILLLDEATSALDSENEDLVQQALDRLMEGRTVLIIAHRFSTIQNTNAVAVLDQGRIIECGTHKELLANSNGLFRKLVEKQIFLQDSQMVALNA